MPATLMETRVLPNQARRLLWRIVGRVGGLSPRESKRTLNHSVAPSCLRGRTRGSSAFTYRGSRLVSLCPAWFWLKVRKTRMGEDRRVRFATCPSFAAPGKDQRPVCSHYENRARGDSTCRRAGCD